MKEMRHIGNIKRISKRELYRLNSLLSERDKTILLFVKACHYMTSRQIMRLLFTLAIKERSLSAIRATNRWLFRLKGMGLLYALPRRVGGVRAGSGANIWSLSMAGVKILSMTEQTNKLFALPRKRNFEPTPKFLEHRLAVAEVYVQLHEMANKYNNGTNKHIELVQIALEPDCWRSYSDIGGRPLNIKPDMYAVTAVSDYEDYWFMEVDLDTESPATVMRKCEQYVRYFQSGMEQRKHGVFPLVVWIVPTDKRKGSLSSHMDAQFSGSVRQIFVVITLDQLPELVRNGKVKIEVKTEAKSPCISSQTELSLESEKDEKR
jgi:hypothetical protein